MSKQNNLKEFLTDVADAIREKKGTTEKINPQDFSEEIRNLPSGEEVNTFGEVMVDNNGRGVAVISEIIVSEGVESIADLAYSNCKFSHTSLPVSLKTIGSQAFASCSNLSTITLPDNVESIGEYAFCGCNNLKNLYCPEKIVSYPNWSFGNCDSMSCAVLSGDVTYIGAYSFTSKKLEFFVLRGVTSVATLESSAFSAKSKIATGTGYIYVPDRLVDSYKSATNWSAYADQIRPLSEYVYLDFADSVAEKICAENIGDGIGTTQAQANAVTTFPTIFKGNTEITSFDEFERFENVTDFGFAAFKDCTSLRSIACPKLKNLPGRTFLGCSSLDWDVNLPSLETLSGDRQFNLSGIVKVSSLGSITSLSPAMFECCTNLIEIVIPSTCATINIAALYGCTALQSIICNPIIPPVLDSVIPDQPTIYVPDESVGEYKAHTNWAKYADKIKPLSEYQPNNE